MNKKGIAITNIFLFIVVSFIIIILLGVFMYSYNVITDSLLTTDVDVG